MKINMSTIKSSGVSLHFEKHKANDTAVNGLQRHNERVPGQKHSNEKIDDSRTADNVFLKKSDGKFKQAVSDVIEKERDKGLKGVRKDAVRMVEATVQLSGKVLDMDENEQERVLRDSYEWLKNEFGENNIVSAVIHKDETNMHLHFDFVPIDEEGKLSAKTIISKPKLQQYQSEFLKELQDKHATLNFKRGGGETNGLSQRDFEVLQKEREEREKELSEYSDKLDLYEDDLIEREGLLEAREERFKARESLLVERENKVSIKEQKVLNGSLELNKSVSSFRNDKQKFNKAIMQVQERNRARESALDERETKVNNKDLEADKKLEEANELTQTWERVKLEVEALSKRIESKLKQFGQTWERILNGVRANEIKQSEVVTTVEKHTPVETEQKIDELMLDMNRLTDKNKGQELS